MWRRLSPPLHRLAAANITSSPSPLRFRSPITLLCRPFASDSGTKAAGSFNHHWMQQYSTTVPNDPDTHEDFRPTNKLEDSPLSLKDIVEQDIKENPVMIYMKGVPELPRCGFSSLAVRVLNEYNVPVAARNILEDPEVKDAVKAFSNWPTFPQIFIEGEFIGGSDIILSMHKNGELKEKLKDIAANQERSSV